MSLDTETTQTTPAPDNAGTTIPGEGAPAPQPQVGGHDDVETRARAMGWRPKEEFNGPAENWRDAEEFVKRGEEEMPVLRERLRDSTRKVAEMEERLRRVEADSTDKLARVERMSVLALQRQRDSIAASYEAAMREAAGSADVQRYDQLQRDQQQALEGINRQISDAVQPRQNGGLQPLPAPVKQVVDSWVQENPWFERDPMLRSVAETYNHDLMRQYPGMDAAENLKRVKHFVQQKFPEKFGITQRQGSATVEGGARMPSGAGPRVKGWDDLPADVRAIGERQITRDKLFKDKSEFARMYWEQE